MNLILILLGVIAFIVLTTTKFKLHPFFSADHRGVPCGICLRLTGR